MIWAFIHQAVRDLTTRFHKILKVRDELIVVWSTWNFTIASAAVLPDACQIVKWYSSFDTRSPDFENSRQIAEISWQDISSFCKERHWLDNNKSLPLSLGTLEVHFAADTE